MKAPTINKEDETRYEGKILKDVEVDYYALKGDVCEVGGELAKILTEPIKSKNNLAHKEIFTATVRIEG